MQVSDSHPRYPHHLADQTGPPQHPSGLRAPLLHFSSPCPRFHPLAYSPLPPHLGSFSERMPKETHVGLLWPASLPLHPAWLILEKCLFLAKEWLGHHPHPLARQCLVRPDLFEETQSQSHPHQASLHINSEKTSSIHALTRQTLAAPIG